MGDRSWVSSFAGHAPSLAPDVFVDRAARIIGRVELGTGSSVWPGAVLRADDDAIVVGPGSAVLDLALLEAPSGSPVVVGREALVSHKACLHGACVDDGALIGIGAIVLDQAHVGAEALVGAGAIVPPGMDIPAAMLVLGQPAKVIRSLTREERAKTQAQVAEVAAKSAAYLRSSGDGSG